MAEKKHTAKRKYQDYTDFIKRIGYGQLEEISCTHDGYPLSVKEAKFINSFLEHGDVRKALKEAGLSLKSVAGKEYITDEISYRIEEAKKKAVASSEEILQYLTKVMRGEIKDQFGLDAPLSERTRASVELARRIIDAERELKLAELQNTPPEIKVTINWEGLETPDEKNS